MTELKAAELLSEIVPSAEMVKFAKHGSTVTTAAVKLARAYTGRKYIAVPHEHPFFSFDDWFIGSTVMNKGVPEEIRQLTLKFHYNDHSSLQRLFDEYPGEIAAVMLEAATSAPPSDDFLQNVQKTCRENGTVFILDEMITGFRWHLQGAQKYYGITPDLATFGKAMANGMAVAALVGKREIMELGSILTKGAERVFLTSTTHGAEMSALGAFIKTIEIIQRDQVITHIWDYGQKLIDGMNEIATDLGIQNHFSLSGYPCSPVFATKDHEGNHSLPLRTVFLQEMIKQGVIMPYVAISFAHKKDELQLTLNAASKALKTFKLALENGVESYINGHIVQPVFRKHN